MNIVGERVHLADRKLKKGERFDLDNQRFKIISIRKNGKFTIRNEEDHKSFTIWTDQIG